MRFQDFFYTSMFSYSIILLSAIAGHLLNSVELFVMLFGFFISFLMFRRDGSSRGRSRCWGGYIN